MNTNNMNNEKIQKVIIAGGGTAGWMTAAALSKLLGKNLDITLIESSQIPTIGVGEATIPTLVYYHQLLGINEAEIMAASNATYKLGINFENWRDVGEDYMHAFGVTGKDCWAAGFQHFWLKAKEKDPSLDFGDFCIEAVAAKAQKFAHLPNNGLNYAFHIDASLYAQYLRKFSEGYGVKCLDDTITKVNVDDKSGYISSLDLTSGQNIEADLFIDCTGQKALLIEGALHTGYEDWGHWLLCDSAIAVQTKSSSPAKPYTRSIAFEYGWQWQIPLQNRVGNGLVYSSHYISDDDAEKRLLANLSDEELITKPLRLKYRIGQRKKHWHKNCVAIGLSSGFIEPLESTAIHLIHSGILGLMRNFPSNGIKESDIQQYNNTRKFEADWIRDFIILHYVVTNRDDSEMWRHYKLMSIPDTLAHKIKLFKETGKVFREGNELFEDSWQQVMIGQGLKPETYHDIVNMMSEEELDRFIQHIKSNIDKTVEQLPKHEDYIKHFCAANTSLIK